MEKDLKGAKGAITLGLFLCNNKDILLGAINISYSLIVQYLNRDKIIRQKLLLIIKLYGYKILNK